MHKKPSIDLLGENRSMFLGFLVFSPQVFLNTREDYGKLYSPIPYFAPNSLY